MNDEKKIDALVKRAVDAGLEGLDFLASFSYDTLAREYNGIGPEWAGEYLRDLVTDFLSLFEPAALIHDMRNSVADGSQHGFHFANGEFLLNCLKLAKRRYAWWHWRRYRAIAAANAMFDFVEGVGGWKAWIEATARYREKFLSHAEMRRSWDVPPSNTTATPYFRVS